MIVEQALYAALQAVFSGKLYPVQLPDPAGNALDTIGTYAIYTKVGGEAFSDLEGDLPLSRPRMQVSIYAVGYADLKAKESAVRVAMKAANDNDSLLNISASVPVEGYESETNRYFSHMDFYCWQSE